MEKRLIIAIALSLLVLLSWSVFSSKMYPPVNNDVTTQKSAVLIPAPVKSAPQEPSAVSKPAEVDPKDRLTFREGKYNLIFNKSGASIQEISFPDYQDYRFILNDGFLLKNQDLRFRKESDSNGVITFIASDDEKEVTKKFILSNSNYIILLEVIVKNKKSTPLHFNINMIASRMDFHPDQNEARFQDAAVSLPEKTLHPSLHKNFSSAGLKFLGWRDRYFCGIVEPQHKEYSVFINKLNSQAAEISLASADLEIPPQQSITQTFHIYLGPQDLSIIKKLNSNWQAVIYYGTFDFIAKLLAGLLTTLYGIVHNWGWAIVLFSIVIYIVLYPLTLKQMRSMREMQLLQPHIEELRKEYKDNPQKLNKAIMDLYKEHKVNPLGGCLPMLLQIPIFFALYQLLLRSVALKGAHFLWIKDLSEPDKLFTLPQKFPVISNEINLLPILMTIGMFIQQKISTASTSSNAEQQKIMMIVFPLLFGFIFYRMPSGLVLYWFINSTFMLVYQLRVNLKK